MPTNSRTHIAAVAALLAAAAACFAANVKPAAAATSPASTCGGSRTLLAAGTPSALRVTRTLGRTASLRPTYGWPVKPFDRQHPVRAFLNDPRIGAGGPPPFPLGHQRGPPAG